MFHFDTEEITYLAAENKIIVGYEDSSFKPDNAVTRAEAAVILYRAVKLDTQNNENSSAENVPESNDKENTKPQADHIYTLYPGRDLILLESITATTKNDEEAYRITYRIASDENEYSSVIPYDTEIKGLKSAVSQLASGDVLIMNTAFHGYIGYLHVVASMNKTVPQFNDPYTGNGDYTVGYGKITAINESGRATLLTVDNGFGIKTETVINKVETNVYSNWKKNEKWSKDGIGSVDIESEDVYVFIRYTNGVSTDIIVSDINR